MEIIVGWPNCTKTLLRENILTIDFKEFRKL